MHFVNGTFSKSTDHQRLYGSCATCFTATMENHLQYNSIDAEPYVEARQFPATPLPSRGILRDGDATTSMVTGLWREGRSKVECANSGESCRALAGVSPEAIERASNGA